jgi:hypothetical protein
MMLDATSKDKSKEVSSAVMLVAKARGVGLD